MQIALYKGRSGVSQVIRWFTRSPYSHAALLFDEGAIVAGKTLRAGTVIEAWDGGVKCSPSLSTLHTRGTVVDVFRFAPALAREEHCALAREAVRLIGTPYDWLDVLRFVTRRSGSPQGRVFCSELVVLCCERVRRPLFLRTEAWRVPPDWLSRTLGLEFDHTEVTK